MRKCRIIIVVFFMLLGASCQKDDLNGNGTVLVTARENGVAVPQALIYLKADTLANPGLPLAQYDQSMRADASGQASFEDLKPGNYYFFATGFSETDQRTVTGETHLTIIRRYRQNDYTITIAMHR